MSGRLFGGHSSDCYASERYPCIDLCTDGCSVCNVNSSFLRVGVGFYGTAGSFLCCNHRCDFKIQTNEENHEKKRETKECLSLYSEWGAFDYWL